MFLYNNVYYFRYFPRGYGKLNIFDQYPLVLPLSITGPIIMGINLHWIPVPLRLKFIQWTIALYQKGAPPTPVVQPATTIEGEELPGTTPPPPPPTRLNSTFRLWYRIVKNTPAIAFATVAVRKYYIGRCSSVQIVEPEFWDDLPTLWAAKYRARYLRKSISNPSTMV